MSAGNCSEVSTRTRFGEAFGFIFLHIPQAFCLDDAIMIVREDLVYIYLVGILRSLRFSFVETVFFVKRAGEGTADENVGVRMTRWTMELSLELTISSSIYCLKLGKKVRKAIRDSSVRVLRRSGAGK